MSLAFYQIGTVTIALNNNIVKEILTSLKQFVKKQKKLLSRENRKEPLWELTLIPRFYMISVRKMAQMQYWDPIRLIHPFTHNVDVLAMKHRSSSGCCLPWMLQCLRGFPAVWLVYRFIFGLLQGIQKERVCWLPSWLDNIDKCILTASQKGWCGKIQRTGHVYREGKNYSVSWPLTSLCLIRLYCLFK